MSVRVFVEPGSTGIVSLSQAESHYLVRVRRAQEGAAIEALDGAGGRVRAVVRDADPRSARIELGAPIPTAALPARTLLLGLPDRAPLLEALDHALCLGAQTVTLVRCAHGADAPPGAARVDRTLRAAMRQCGRPSPPAVTGPHPFAQAVEEAPAGERFVATPGAPARPLDPVGHATVLVGPEGGLTAQELALARDRGFMPLGLGPWTLRTPLAVAAALTRLLPCAPNAGA